MMFMYSNKKVNIWTQTDEVQTFSTQKVMMYKFKSFLLEWPKFN